MNTDTEQQEYWKHLHALHTAIETAVLDILEQEWREAKVKNPDWYRSDEYPRDAERVWWWLDHRKDEFEEFDVPGFGAFRVAGRIRGTEVGDYADWSGPRAVILATGHGEDTKYYQATGKNISHNGEEWGYVSFMQVTPVIQTIVRWDSR